MLVQPGDNPVSAKTGTAQEDGAAEKTARKMSPPWVPKQPHPAKTHTLTLNTEQTVKRCKIPSEEFCWGLLED